MKISKKQLRQIIREEYARIQQKRVVRENKGHEDLASEVYAMALSKGMSPAEAGELAADAYNTGKSPFQVKMFRK